MTWLIQGIKRALGSGQFNYCMRLDIKGYYASIQHDILFSQIKNTFDDPRLIHYFDQIIHHTVYDGGNYRTPNQGIPMRSSLSPFFGALYLKPLDEEKTCHAGNTKKTCTFAVFARSERREDEAIQPDPE